MSLVVFCYGYRDQLNRHVLSHSFLTRRSPERPVGSTYERQMDIYDTVNHASPTLTLVNAAKRLVDELPEGTPAPDVIKHWLKRAREDEAARGVEWPNITPEQQGKAGLAWSVFPNMSILQGITFAL